MRRKLVKQGAATMMISLPAKWIKENSLEKGSEVDLEQIDNQLMISAEAIERKSETSIGLINLSESSIRTLITNTYRKGYDRIHVNFKNDLQLAILKHTIKTKLIGFEITKKEKNTCVVESITEPSEEQFDNLVRKFLFGIEELFKITENRLNNPENTYDFEELQERIQRYDNFCRRVISKRKLINKNSEFLWCVLVLLLHGQRELYHLNRALDFKVSEKLKKFFKETKNVFDLIQKAYLEKDVSYMAELHELNNDLMYKKGYSLLEKSKGKETIILYYILSSTRKFFQVNSPLSGILI